LLALGWGESARIATIASGCVWTMALAVTAAAKAPRSTRREMLDLAGASSLDALAWTQPWEALPTLVVGVRTSASLAVIVAVVTEMVVGVDRGVGARAVSAQIAGDTTALTLDVLGVGIVGWAINRVLRVVEDRVRRVVDG
jgi:NitT/TauT family transport system permease protein